MNERAVVFGAGFLGTRTVKSLLSRGFEVAVVTRSPLDAFRQELVEGAQVVVGEADALANIDNLIDGAQQVIWAIGGLAPPAAQADPGLNRRLTLDPLALVLGRLSGHAGVRFTYISSGGTIYGRTPHVATPEDHPVAPLSAYGEVKVEAERLVADMAARGSFDALVLRVANAYGPGQDSRNGQGVVDAAFRHLVSGTPFTIFGDGSAQRDYVYVDDVAEVIADLAKLAACPDVLNVSSGVAVTVDDLLTRIEKTAGIELQRRYVAQRPFDLQWSALDHSLLSRHIRFRPTELDEGLRRTWRHLQSIEAGIDEQTKGHAVLDQVAEAKP